MKSQETVEEVDPILGVPPVTLYKALIHVVTLLISVLKYFYF